MKGRSALENITALPAECFSVDRVHNMLIVVKVGMLGFVGTHDEIASRLMRQHDAKTPDELADKLNEQDGITRGQRQAMEIGSMFGWEVPGANVENYNADGTPNREAW